MRTVLRKVGNSRGIIIPNALLAACELGEEIELTLQDKKIVLEAVKEPRAGWFFAYQANADVDAFESLPVSEGDAEWVW